MKFISYVKLTVFSLHLWFNEKYFLLSVIGKCVFSLEALFLNLVIAEPSEYGVEKKINKILRLYLFIFLTLKDVIYVKTV